MNVDLDQERARIRARTASTIRTSRARRLLAEQQDGETLENRLRIGWPKLDPDEASATLELAREMAVDRSHGGRRLEGAELEEAREAMMARNGVMSAERAREFAEQRMREEPEISCVKLHKEAAAAGYGGNYRSFYGAVFTKVRDAIKSGKATAMPPRAAPPAGKAAPETSPSAPTSEPPAGGVDAGAPTDASEPLLEIDSLHANIEDNDRCSISLVIDAPAEFINRIGDIVAALRGIRAAA